MTATIVVTGASGFVGRSLCLLLAEMNFSVKALVRAQSMVPGDLRHSGIEVCEVQSLEDPTTAAAALSGSTVLVHLAGLAHIPHDQALSNSFTHANVDMTRALALAAARAGVTRFVFLSTIKVNGERSAGRGFRDEDVPDPVGSYGQSKLQAELCLKQVCSATGLEYVILRPPLIYGPEVRANFLKLMNLVNRALPLPFAAIQNKRSLLSVWNLASIVAAVIDKPQAANQTLLISDDEDVSISELVKRLAVSMHRKVRLFRVSPILLRVAFTVAGKSEDLLKLSDPLQADISRTKRLLGWRAPVAVDEGIARTVNWYLKERSRR